ncbi:ATP-dependent RNA helicase DDX24 [Thalassophryne amazonica]|uniref:ATP-dependent RNA helicase DDX24 n=1 Tax=Thalassophryne amazonica TaxID=390379 RepID=UPI001471C800|nr:ATP-dependent RNA helicase DDX24 [Thalassophryne amazonica]
MKVKTKPKTKHPSFGKHRTSRSIHVKGEWKAVELDPSLFSEEGMEDLVCFEELRSYCLVDTKKAAAQAARELQREKKKAKKRKMTEGEKDGGELGHKEEEKKDDTPKKKAKMKKNKKLPACETEVKHQGVVAGTEGGEDEEVKEKDEVIKDVSIEESAIGQSKIAKKSKKKNKKTQCSEKDAASKVQQNLKPSSDVHGPPKKQIKNWTNAALSGSEHIDTDVSAWKDLHVPSLVLKALSSLGFSSPTPIQALALPPAIRDHMDILGAAETGSGKTLAFGIPIIHTILEWRKSSKKKDDNRETCEQVDSLYLPAGNDSGNSADQEDNMSDEEEEGRTSQSEDEGELTTGDGTDKLGCVQVIDDVEFNFDQPGEAKGSPASCQSPPLLALVLTPTRELAVQVKHHIDAVAKFTDIKTAIVVGGMSQQKQRRVLKRKPEIIIATPGRLWDLIQEKHPHLLNLRQLRCLVIDEADRMVERGHFAELENLLEMLNTRHFNPTRQTFVFSATLTMVHSLPTRLLQKKNKVEQKNKLQVLMEKVGIKSKPKIIDLTRKEATVETLTETQIHCQKDEKDFFLYYFLLQYPGRTMVFANSIDCIKRLSSLLVILDCTPVPLHANMHQKQRLKNLERFAEKESCVLLTTDVAARGLDIPNVQHVIHYQVPRTSETYVHRSGRTARATKEGLSLLLIGPDDMMNFKRIYRTLGKDEELPMFPVETRCLDAIKERVNLARNIEKIEFHNSKVKQQNSWFRRAAEALEMELDEDLLIGGAKDEEADKQQLNMVKGMKKQLKHLLAQPVFKSVIKTKYPTQMGKLSLPEMPVAKMESALARVSKEKDKSVQLQKKKQNKAQRK